MTFRLADRTIPSTSGPHARPPIGFPTYIQQQQRQGTLSPYDANRPVGRQTVEARLRDPAAFEEELLETIERDSQDLPWSSGLQENDGEMKGHRSNPILPYRTGFARLFEDLLEEAIQMYLVECDPQLLGGGDGTFVHGLTEDMWQQLPERECVREASVVHDECADLGQWKLSADRAAVLHAAVLALLKVKNLRST
eukprot:g1586.t1